MEPLNDDDDDDVGTAVAMGYLNTLVIMAEPMLRLTVAGVGGFISGLAVVRYRRQSPLMSSASIETQVFHPVAMGGGSSSSGRRGVVMIPRQTTSSNLPTVWGLSCFVFCGTLDMVRLYHPTESIVSYWAEWQQRQQQQQQQSDDNIAVDGRINSIQAETSSATTATTTPLVSPFLVTCSDYALGGAFAGGAFRGMQIRTSQAYSKGRVPFSTIRPSIVMGMLTGMALSLLAGIVHASLDYVAWALLETQHAEEQVQEEAAKESGKMTTHGTPTSAPGHPPPRTL